MAAGTRRLMADVISIVTREVIAPVVKLPSYQLGEFARARDRMVHEFAAWLREGPSEDQVGAQLRDLMTTLHELTQCHFNHGGVR